MVSRFALMSGMVLVVAAGCSAFAAPDRAASKPAAATAPAAPVRPVAPTPAVAASPAQPAAPVVAAPSQPKPAPVVAAPPAKKPAAAIVHPPLPQKRPNMAEEKLPATYLFARVKLPSTGKPRAIGYYPRGCLQGAIELPVDGPTWQVMRTARNRNWGHPELVKFLERFAPLAAKATGWHGVLVGDMAQPRGGPLPYGHMSHQIGLDVDIWYMPMPADRLTIKQRNTISASNLVAADGKHVNDTWSKADAAFIRTAAEQPEVERVLVNAAIKKKLCEMEGKHKPAWMDKVRPWYGHADHMHVRLKCPANSPHCRHQPPVPDSAQCGKALDYWFSDRVLHPKPSKKPSKPRKPITLADLPAACKSVVDAPAKHSGLTDIGQ